MTAALALPATPEPDAEECRASALEHLSLLGIVPTPPRGTTVERLVIYSAEEDEFGPVTETHYTGDDMLRQQLRKGGVRGVEHEEHGCVAVMLGIGGEPLSRVALNVPFTDAG